MHEELKREFEEKFVWEYKDLFYDSNGEWQSITKSQLNIKSIDEFWDWFESKLPKEVEIEKPWDKISIKCPACRKVSLYTEDNFCPNCGSKLIWE